MHFAVFCQHIEKIEQTSARLEITTLLAELFSELSVDEARVAAYLVQGRVGPLYDPADFGMAEKLVSKAVQAAFAIDAGTFAEVQQRHGDVGRAAEAFRQQQRDLSTGQDLSVRQVYEKLVEITQAAGTGSQDHKQQILVTLLHHATPLGARYLARIPAGAMRLGFSDVTMLDAFSWMLSGDKKLRKRIEKAYHVRPDLGHIAAELKEGGIERMDEIAPQVGSPILMMRAERMSSGDEIIDKLTRCAVEPKFDGFRVQVHLDRSKKRVDLYTRGLEHVSVMYPDIVEGVLDQVKAETVILEGEAIGYNPETNAYLPFQETVQRKRKYGIEEMVKKIPLRLFVFELLYRDGESLIEQPYHERRAQLEAVIPTRAETDIHQATIVTAQSVVLDDPVAVEKQFDTAVTDGLEGIIAKKLDGVYQAGARGSNWIKFKRSYASSALNDTLDCIVMGYDYGKGKRASFGIGAFLVGVFSPVEDKILRIAKIGTGLTDEEWKELRRRCDTLTADEPDRRYVCDQHMSVDVWVKPEIIVEIQADEITQSPIHTAGRMLKAVDTESESANGSQTGYALRFPRLIGFRDDKRVEEATTSAEVVTMAKRSSAL